MYLWANRRLVARTLLKTPLSYSISVARELLDRRLILPKKPVETRAFAANLSRTRVEVVLVSANEVSPSHLYRVTNISRALTAHGLEVAIISASDVKKNVELLKSKVIWEWRTSHASMFDGLDHLDRKDRPSLVYDNDDLTFNARHYNPSLIPGLRKLDPSQLEVVMRQDLPIAKLRMRQADYVSASTKHLLRQMNEFAQLEGGFLIRNHLSSEQIEAADKAIGEDSSGSSPYFNIIYASGSNTHQGDWEVLAEDLWEFMRNKPNVRLTFLGYAPVSRMEIHKSFEKRVRFVRPVSQSQLITELSNQDLSLAPLDTSLEFNHSKSGLKIIHAAVAGCHSLVSETEENREILTNLGFDLRTHLVGQKCEWLNLLSHAESEISVRRSKRLSCSENTVALFGPDALGKKLRPVLQDLGLR